MYGTQNYITYLAISFKVKPFLFAGTAISIILGLDNFKLLIEPYIDITGFGRNMGMIELIKLKLTSIMDP